MIRDESSLNHFFTRDGKEIWRMIAYCPQPTVVLENIVTGERVQWGVGSSILSKYIELVPEREVTNDKGKRKRLKQTWRYSRCTEYKEM